MWRKGLTAAACVFYGLLKGDEFQSEVSDALTKKVNVSVSVCVCAHVHSVCVYGGC